MPNRGGVLSGLLKSFTSPAPESGKDQPITIFEYEDSRLSHVLDAEKNSTSIYYFPSLHRAKEVKNADNYTWTLQSYNLDGIADGPSDLTGTIRLPAAGSITESESPVGNGLYEARAVYHDPRSIADTTVANYFWYYQLDNFGLPTAYSKPFYDTEWQNTADNTVWEWQRNKHGLETKAIGPAGGGGNRPEGARFDKLTTQFVYDGRFNLTKLVQPDEVTFEWQYDQRTSQPILITEPLGYRITNDLETLTKPLFYKIESLQAI